MLVYLYFCWIDTSLKAMQRTSKQRLCYFPGLLGKWQAHDQLWSRDVCAHYVYGDIQATTYGKCQVHLSIQPELLVYTLVVKVVQTLGCCYDDLRARRSSPLKCLFFLFFEFFSYGSNEGPAFKQTCTFYECEWKCFTAGTL